MAFVFVALNEPQKLMIMNTADITSYFSKVNFFDVAAKLGARSLPI
jgi:hypothetical protein